MHLLLCDLDGTLTRTARIDEACFSMALEQEFGIRDFNRDWSSYRLRTDWGQGREILETWFERPPRADELHRLHYRFLSLLEQARHSNPEFFHAQKGAREFVQSFLDHADWQLAVISCGWQTVSRMKLKWAGFPALPLYCPRDCSPEGEAGQDKEGLLREAMRSEGSFEKQACLFLGDNEWDFEAAAAVGCPFLLLGVGELAENLQRRGAAGHLDGFLQKDAVARTMDLVSHQGAA